MKPRPKHSAARKAAVAGGYRSGLEANIARDLNERKITFEYEPTALRYLLPVRGGNCGDCGSGSVGKWSLYTPDFRYACAGGARSVYVESKGRFTPRDRTKMLAVKAQHPKLDIRLLFAYDNKLSKSSETRYSEWADKHGFVYAVGKTIPADWLP